jgi:hypothetical protein
MNLSTQTLSLDPVGCHVTKHHHLPQQIVRKLYDRPEESPGMNTYTTGHYRPKMELERTLSMYVRIRKHMLRRELLGRTSERRCDELNT